MLPENAAPRPDEPTATASPAEETPEAELERFATTRVEAWLKRDRKAPVPEAERERRRQVVLEVRARVEADIAAGTPRMYRCGTTIGGASDVDAKTGFRYREFGCLILGDEPLETAAYNSAILRAWRAGRVKAGSFLDRFVNAADATAWLRSRGRVITRGGEGVEIPGGKGVVRIPQESCGSWSSPGKGESGELFDIERPSARERRVPGWPSLWSEAALIAFREDGAVYIVAEPAGAQRWERCHVFDAATGYHLHTLTTGRDR